MGHIRPQVTVDAGLLLSDLGVLDREIAVCCGVAVKTVRRWRRLYQRRGVVRGQTDRWTPTPCPRCDDAPLDEAAYALLLGWYLGDGHVQRERGGAVHTFSVISDERYPSLIDEVDDALRRVRPGSNPWRRKRPGAWVVAVGWKHWPCLFPQHGPGRKHERPIALECWQEEIVAQHPGPFLRGLLHSDGCRGDEQGQPPGRRHATALRVPPVVLLQRVRRHPRLVRGRAGPPRRPAPA